MPKNIWIFIAVLQGFIFLAHYFLYTSMVRFGAPWFSSKLEWFRAGLFVLSVSFVATSVLTSYSTAAWAQWLYTAAATWMGTFYWLLIASCVMCVVWLGAWAVGYTGNLSRVWWTLVVLACATSVYGLINAYTPRVREISVPLKNLPAAWKGKRAVFIADTHLGAVRGVASSARVAKLIGTLKPEAVFIAGDFYDGPPADYQALANPYGKIVAPLGVYFVSGNHEYFREPNEYFNAARASGMTTLVSEKIILNGIAFVGLNYPDGQTAEKQKTTLEQIRVPQDISSVLIKHVPSHVDVAAAAGIDFMFAGHTHCGQVWPGMWLTNKMFKGYNYGLKPAGDMLEYTTCGVGTWGPPQRVGSTPEVVVVTFTNK